MSYRRVIVRLLAVSALCLPMMAQQAPPSADTFVSSATPTTNYGSSIIEVVGSGNTTYLKFNLSGVPAGATVSKATLRLFVDAVITGGQFDVYNLPGTPTWSESTLKYNTPPPALGTSATGGHPITVSSSSYNTFLLIDITSTVQGWLTNPSSNNGVALALIGSTGYFSFDSKESFLTAHQPELEIALNGSAGAQGPQGPQGPQGLAGPAGPAGPKGDIGVSGATGAQGPQGLTGSTGPQGIQGIQGAPGVNGAVGAVGPQGIGFNFRKAFDNTAAYAINDVVTYNGSSYVAIAATTAPGPNATPDTSSAAWSVMAAQGITGLQGIQGSSGPQGPSGPAGPQGPVGAVGPVGPSGQSLTSVNSLNGLSCSVGGTTGTTALTFSNGAAVATLVCNLPPPPACGHTNGVGQFYTDCSNPPGTPNNPSTYTLQMAQEAAGAFGTVIPGVFLCGTSHAVDAQTPQLGTGVWVFDGSLAGHVFVSTGSEIFCPNITDPTWN